MIYTLVGMSNLGKTHWAERLKRECGFMRIDCDAMVEDKLGAQLRLLGYAGIEDVAKWMGFPYDPQYPQTSKEFVGAERAVMFEIIEKLRKLTSVQPIVIDTCGSVIYTGDDVIGALKELSTVVYLEASLEHRTELFERYIAEPKPVIWGDNAFSPQTFEEPTETLKRCYPDLLEKRSKRYEQMAHKIIPFERHRENTATPFDLFPGLVSPISPTAAEVERAQGIPRR